MMTETPSTATSLAKPQGHAIVRELLNALAGLAFGGLLVALVSLQFFGYRVLTVQSNSMEPKLTRGDLVVTRPVGIDQIEAGDVVLFQDGGEVQFLTLHRVVGFINLNLNILDSATGVTTTESSRLLQTKGDANPAADATPVGADRLRGRLWFAIPGAGLPLAELPLQKILIGLAAASALGWLGLEVRHRRTRAA